MVESYKSAGGCAVSDSAAQTGNPTIPAAAGALPLRAGEITMHELINLYMRQYAGRDVKPDRPTLFEQAWLRVQRDQVKATNLHAPLFEANA